MSITDDEAVAQQELLMPSINADDSMRNQVAAAEQELLTLSINSDDSMRNQVVAAEQELLTPSINVVKSKRNKVVQLLLNPLTGNHQCSIIGKFRRFIMFIGIGTYIFDTISDIIFTGKEFKNGNHSLGILMSIFVIVPNVWGNYNVMDLHRIENTAEANTNDGVVEQEENVGCCQRLRTRLRGLWKGIKKWMFPYPIISMKNAVFNLLCILQLRPIVLVLDLLNHDRKSVEKITRQSADFTDLRYFETVTENIPQIAIQLCLLLQMMLIEKTTVSFEEIYRIVALLSKVFSLCLVMANFQLKNRLATKASYDFMRILHPLKNVAQKSAILGKLNEYIALNLQSLSQCGIYVLMILSRTIFIGILFLMLYDIRIPYLPHYSITLPLLICELHHIVCFIYGWYIARARLWKWPVPMRRLVYCYVWCFRNIFFNQLPRKVGDIHNLIMVYTLNLLQIILVGALFTHQQMSFTYDDIGNGSALVVVRDLPMLHSITFTSLSIVLYCLAGICVALYFKFLDPDKLKVKHDWKTIGKKLGDCDLYCDYKSQVIGTAVVTNTYTATVQPLLSTNYDCNEMV